MLTAKGADMSAICYHENTTEEDETAFDDGNIVDLKTASFLMEFDDDDDLEEECFVFSDDVVDDCHLYKSFSGQSQQHLGTLLSSLSLSSPRERSPLTKASSWSPSPSRRTNLLNTQCHNDGNDADLFKKSNNVYVDDDGKNGRDSDYTSVFLPSTQPQPRNSPIPRSRSEQTGCFTTRVSDYTRMVDSVVGEIFDEQITFATSGTTDTMKSEERTASTVVTDSGTDKQHGLTFRKITDRDISTSNPTKVHPRSEDEEICQKVHGTPKKSALSRIGKLFAVTSMWGGGRSMPSGTTPTEGKETTDSEKMEATAKTKVNHNQAGHRCIRSAEKGHDTNTTGWGRRLRPSRPRSYCTRRGGEDSSRKSPRKGGRFHWFRVVSHDNDSSAMVASKSSWSSSSTMMTTMADSSQNPEEQ